MVIYASKHCPDYIQKLPFMVCLKTLQGLNCVFVIFICLDVVWIAFTAVVRMHYYVIGYITYTAAPKSLPTLAVSPIASAPQKATRNAPLAIDAPPA